VKSAIVMDDEVMKAGLLMEAAQTQQKLADGSLRRLKTVSQDLLGGLREEVRQAVQQEFQGLSEEARLVAHALHTARRAAEVRILLWSILTVAVCSVIPMGLAYYMLPSQGEITRLRSRHDELSSRIALLQSHGGGIDLRRCGADSRLCVRVDRSAPAYGPRAEYLIVKGY
jgi:hypothetical protein